MAETSYRPADPSTTFGGSVQAGAANPDTPVLVGGTGTVYLQAQGDSTDISISLVPKGSGSYGVAVSSATATAGTLRAEDVSLTLTSASAVNSGEALRGTLTADVEVGQWANGIVGKVDFSTSGYVAGLAGAVCAEIDMPAGAIPGGTGTYSAFEAEINCPTGFVGGGVPMTPLIINVWGAASTEFDSAGYLFILTGVQSGSGNMWYDHQGTAPTNVEEWLRVKTPSGVRYLALYNAVV